MHEVWHILELEDRRDTLSNIVLESLLGDVVRPPAIGSVDFEDRSETILVS